MRHLKVKTEADAARVQRTKVRGLQDLGEDATVRDDATPLTARVDWGRWIVECPCGAGVAVQADWRAAYCLGCGRILTAVIFPPTDEREAVEAVLGMRDQRHQFYFPEKGETVATLRAENVAHGLPPDETGADTKPPAERPPVDPRPVDLAFPDLAVRTDPPITTKEPT